MGTTNNGLYREVQVPSLHHSDALIDSLLSARLFEGVEREEIVAILSAFDETRFNPGHRVTLQGMRGSDFFIITAGSARVLIDGDEVATLGSGDFFGEIGVLSDGLRTATVQAASQLRCLVLPHKGLEALLIAHPRLAVNLLQEVVSRFRSVTAAAGRSQPSSQRAR